MREIEAFIAVAEELHFGRAADRLHRSPSNVSQAVRALERRVGAELFQRTSRSVRLSPIGEQLLAEWRPAMRSLSAGLLEARRAIDPIARPLRIGCSVSMPEDVRSALSEQYRMIKPGRPVVWVRDRVYDMYMWNADSGHDLDLALLLLPPGHTSIDNPYLITGPVIRYCEAAIMVPNGHPLSGRPSIDVEELAGHDMANPDVAASLYTDWLPERTPQGRPISSTVIATRHLDRLFETVISRSAAHLTARWLSASPAWEPIRDRVTLVPLTGLPPFTLRAFWPDTESARAAAEFARVIGIGEPDLIGSMR
ncbi:LysR family transcriptional regulator [Nocardia sp. NPDC020380]|uniref:LysR family transcriptional regulator n=1 Tax=Nocardia sp. NPDC020380 TaxID=3364309 RepID=UPI0037A812DB